MNIARQQINMSGNWHPQALIIQQMSASLMLAAVKTYHSGQNVDVVTPIVVD